MDGGELCQCRDKTRGTYHPVSVWWSRGGAIRLGARSQAPPSGCHGASETTCVAVVVSRFETTRAPVACCAAAPTARPRRWVVAAHRRRRRRPPAHGRVRTCPPQSPRPPQPEKRTHNIRVTDVGMRELRGLTALTELHPGGCRKMTGRGGVGAARPTKTKKEKRNTMQTHTNFSGWAVQRGHGQVRELRHYVAEVARTRTKGGRG